MSLAAMHEKDGHDHYRYDTYAPLMKSATLKGVKAVHCTSETATVLKGGTHTTMTKHSTTIHSKDGTAKARCCTCCAGRGSSTFWAALLTNIGVCTLLLAYTLLGSFIFLAIEGGASQMPQRTLASTNRHQKQLPVNNNNNNNHHGRHDTANLTFPQLILLEAVEARQKTVENIWDITVSLNILYRENWTRLASMEIARFQEQFVNRLLEEMTQINNMQHAGAPGTAGHELAGHGPDNNWTFARAFLYSLTILTTIGYGSVAPRTVLGRMITLAYAVLGIPLTLVYLSSTGGMLAKVARGVFSRVLCCCLCSNCGYCCYDEKRMEEKEKRMKRKRQQMELQQQQQQQQHLALSGQEPYYVRSGSLQNSVNSPEKQLTMLGTAAASAVTSATTPDHDSTAGSSDSESRASMHGLSILAPILLCVAMMSIYIVVGALTLFRLESLPLSDGVYFCFMALSTIGFGTLAPGTRRESAATTWFCSGYIMAGMALTAMCFNVLHDEILHRLRHMKNTNLYQRNPTEETLITGTPTSVIFAQEPDLGQLHLQHDCHSVHHTVGHELIPIVTMAPNGPGPGLSSELLDRATSLSDVGPVGVGQPMMMPAPGEQTVPHGLGMASSGIGSMMTSNLNTGVYTLPEESEHESEECPAM
uniref:Potassium channel domain-containing protein n=1 Tax=Anopheles quadriannulatus TaxID=34691 RepID=A0A182WRI1_ANOQN